MSAGVRRQVKDAMGRLAGLAGSYARHFRSQMTIVAFHRVEDEIEADALTVGAAKFEAFCKFFSKHFTVVPLSEQLAGCRSGRDMGGTLSITFDDGYRDNAEVAAPILQRCGLPATFFVTTGFIGSQFVPAWDAHLPHQPGWMSWDDVRKLRHNGFDIGNHTDSHLDMGTAELEVMRLDLAVSKRKLHEELGVPMPLFAHPFGGREHISQRSRDLVRAEGFACCLSCFGGVNSVGSDPFALNRIGIAEWFASPNQLGFELLTGQA